MRPLYLLAAAAVVTATPATATIMFEPAHVSQGTLVHNTGTATTAALIIADLGEKGPNIVNLDAMTTTNNQLRMQQGTGQSDFTGAKISGNNYAGILSGDIYLTNHAGMSWIELGLTSTATGTIDFVLTNSMGITTDFNDIAIGPGNTHFGFLAAGGDPISNLFYSMDLLSTGGQNPITDIKQVRIIPSTAVPEATTWAMMLVGFGAMGFSVRRSRRKFLPQLA